ncbi:MAG: PilW family protein [Bacillota bacterium]
METKNEGFTLIEVMVTSIALSVIVGGIATVLIMSRTTSRNISDKMLLSQAAENLKRHLTEDLNEADNVNASSEELEIISNGDTIARYSYNSSDKIIEYSRDKGSGLESQSDFPRSDCNIESVEFEEDPTTWVKFDIEFSKETSSKKEDNLLTYNLESIVKVKGYENN